MRLNPIVTSILLLATASTVARAQQRPPVRQLGAVVAKATEPLGNAAGIRALPGGSVLVNDLAGRRVLLFESKLGTFTVVADSTSATANAYGGRSGSLVAYRGDSSIFVDPASVSMLVIDPQGKIARVMAIPRGEDAGMIGNALGNTTFDPSGRLIYRAGAGMRFAGGTGGRVVMGGPNTGAARGLPAPPEIPDSALIFAVDLATRKLDTLGYIRTPKIKMEIQRDDNGGVRMQSMLNPLPVVDDWAVLPDGTVAFVRGRDYHVDFTAPDGSTTSAAKIPFDWQRLTEEDKVAFIDSVKAARERLGAHAPLPTAGTAPQPGAAGGGMGGAPQVMVFSQTIGGPQGGGGGATRTGPQAGAPMQMQFVPASELPDYKPAFFAGSTRADLDGNLWVRTIPTTAIHGGPVYDVIDRKGTLIDRVQVPENTSIIGFGPEGAVYLINRSGTTATLERAAIR